VGSGAIDLRLPYRSPFRGEDLLAFIGERAIAGIESYDGTTYRRTLNLPRSTGIAELSDGHVACRLYLNDLRDLSAAVQRCRRLLDLDADPVAIDDVLADDPMLRRIVRSAPGRRVPGAVDGAELAFRAILGQQVSVKGARTLAERLVGSYGKPLTEADGALTHLFPTADAIAEADLSDIGMPAARRASLRAVAALLAGGEVSLDPGADRADTARRLLEVPGIGPWTVSYIAMRALRDPDAFLPTDLGVKRAMERLGIEGDPASTAERWRPWRAYALQHLWQG
jgi:AraC family transcriptional regulator of adaptative response / DNA-3-methyladenine glycosylase II